MTSCVHRKQWRESGQPAESDLEKQRCAGPTAFNPKVRCQKSAVCYVGGQVVSISMCDQTSMV
jgi:hypothetical protein